MNAFLPVPAQKNKHLRKTVFLLSCLAVTAAFGQNAAADENTLLEPAPSFEKSPAFKVLLNRQPGSSGYEIKRIEYLLERITRTSSIFIRNGEKYPGKTAVLHMRWKYARYQQEIKTAEDFAQKIANASRKTQEEYKVRLQNGKLYRTTQVLLNELRYLDQALAEARSAAQDDVKSISTDTGTQT